MQPRRIWNPVQCSLQHSQRLPKPDHSRLLLEPPCHPPLSFLLGNHLSTLSGIKPFLDLLTNINVVLNIIERGVIWKLFKKVANLLLGCLHSSYLLETFYNEG